MVFDVNNSQKLSQGMPAEISEDFDALQNDTPRLVGVAKRFGGYFSQASLKFVPQKYIDKFYMGKEIIIIPTWAFNELLIGKLSKMDYTRTQ